MKEIDSWIGKIHYGDANQVLKTVPSNSIDCIATDPPYGYSFIELFSGIGGFRLGLERSDWKCVWSNDWDKWACQIYRKNFGGDDLIEGDIKSININTIPNHTLLTAGFPCQSFSIAGERKGFEDSRGTLFFHIIRVVKAKRPSLLLLENVRGLLSTQRGYCFYRIVQTLDELGYDVEWQVLNSKYFGVPQNRQRVFIIGHLRGTGGRQIFPVGCFEKKNDKSSGRPMIVGNIYPSGGEAGVIFDSKGIFPTMKQGKRGGMAGVPPILDKMRIRRLTPTECERLQGFPDGWTEGVSNTQRYKLLGNAVTVNVVEFLGKQLLDCTYTHNCKEKRK